MRSLAAALLFTICLPKSSLASTKWLKCTGPFDPNKQYHADYKIELSTYNYSASLIRTSKATPNPPVKQWKVIPGQQEFLANATWYPTEVVIGPFDGVPITIYATDKTWNSFLGKGYYLKINRETLLWQTGNGIDQYGSVKVSSDHPRGTCSITSAPNRYF